MHKRGRLDTARVSCGSVFAIAVADASSARRNGRAGARSHANSNEETLDEALTQLRLGAVLALGATAAVTLAATASAGQVLRETIHEEETFVIDDFCDVPGLTVEVVSVADLRVQAVTHGPNDLAYFLERARRTDVLTNPANDKSVSIVANEIAKDLRVTDNGDGTLTILVLATGNGVLYGQDGNAIARNPGQVRFEIVVDHNGTPTDPFDDEFLADLGLVKGSTGRSDDFCEAAVLALS